MMGQISPSLPNSPTIDDTQGRHHLEQRAPMRCESDADFSTQATLFRFNRVSTT